jgi:spore coat protein H
LHCYFIQHFHYDFFMKIGFSYYLFFLIVPVVFLHGCRKENDDITDPEKEAFNFIVTDSQRAYINASRGEQYEITDPIPQLQFAGDIYTINRFEIRGDGTLNFTRKGFGVNMDSKITLRNPSEPIERKYEEFKLLAMVYDYTYIENSTAVGLFKEVGLWPVYDFFTEVRLNDHTQGLYHFIEDPFEYFIEQKNASFVVRRGYNHIIKTCSASPDKLGKLDEYIARFKRIYSVLPLYSGRQMYDTLSSYIDMEQYFTKLSIDMLVKNGDYTDEAIFYTKVKNGKEVLEIFPWDYDDIFSDQPHEIGRDWATGTVFGHREYNSMNDVIADVGSKLLYSIEEDLDYKIAKDNFLYQEYLKTLSSVIEKIDPAAIDRVFDYTNEHIGPFYDNDSIIEQSKYDVDETNFSLFVSNLAEKRQMLKDRRAWILEELGKQKNR